MEKIKNTIKSIYRWLDKEGGLLHILACYAIMLTFASIGIGWATLITWIVAIGKEVCDFVRKTNNLKQCGNDIIRDAIGWGFALIVLLIMLSY